MRRVTWRMWIPTLLAIGIYIGCGFWLANNDVAEAWMYRIGLTAATLVPIVFVGIYTWFGLTGHAKWWRNPIGTALVQAALTLIPITAPLAWVFWVDNGMLTSTWLAWFEVSGPIVSALAWLRLCYIWIRIRIHDVNNGTGAKASNGTH